MSPEQRAWGGEAAAMIRDWLRAGRIERAGMRQAIGAQAHARNYPLYRKVAP